MKEDGVKRSVADILRSSMKELTKSDADLYKRIISLADKEFFEQHQTAGSLRTLADELLAIPAERGVEGGEDNEGN